MLIAKDLLKGEIILKIKILIQLIGELFAYMIDFIIYL